MKVEIRSPATIPDMAELGGATTRIHWAVLMEMFENGETWAVWVDGDLVAIAGLYPIGEGEAEAWFYLTPASAPALPAIIRHIRLTQESGRYRSIIAVVRARAGSVIARRTGFTLQGSYDLGEAWIWKHCSEAATTPPRSQPRRSSAAA